MHAITLKAADNHNQEAPRMQTTEQKLLSMKDIQPIRGLNMIGLYTLVKREVGRFLSVYLQTLIAPAVTAFLFFTVFALAFGGYERMVGDMNFLVFLAPGLIIMSMVQNAFANTSSSIIISKVQGSIVDVLMPPLGSAELLIGYMMGGVIRGLLVGCISYSVFSFFIPLKIVSWPIVLSYGVLGTMMLAALGMAGGIYADRFDHIAAVTNFFITPLTFLSGTFYSINALPPAWHAMALYNPFFYMIDGFRAGITGHADGDVQTGLLLLTGVNGALILLILVMLRTGYKLKS